MKTHDRNGLAASAIAHTRPALYKLSLALSAMALLCGGLKGQAASDKEPVEEEHACSDETCSMRDKLLDDPNFKVPQSPDFFETHKDGSKPKRNDHAKGKKATTEPLTVSRSVAPAGTQPGGALTDRVVYTSGGHGWTYDNETQGKWITQRGVTQEMNEDYGNLDQMNMFAYYAFNAGATVVAFRPIGNQTNEVVLDNTSGAITWSGTWSDSSSTIYYGSSGQTPYRFASIASTETATATYTPNIPVAGYYPIYTWVRHGGDRTKQLYRINHTGGQSQVRTPHYLVGNGWVYLGTYYFNAGSSAANGSVVISNLEPSPTVGSVIIADAIRFGNGMGNVVPTAAGSETPTISKYPREEECSRYWVQRMVGQGMSSSLYNGSSSDQNDNVGAPARMAREMNREASENIYKRIYLGFHSNAGSGAARGTLGLYNNTSLFPGTATPNQFRWAQIIGAELNNDMVGIGSPPMELSWHNRGSNITYARSDFAFGEINNGSISSEFDATIIEVAYHDNASDSKLMRDPNVRDWVARASLHAVIKYMNEFDSLPLNFLPEPPTNVRAAANTTGGIVVSWSVPTAMAGSGAATSYVVYRSTDGYGFGNPVTVSGGSTTSTTLTGLSANVDYYFRVAAVNAGGESMPSDTVGCRRSSDTSAPKVLFVNGYDRFGRFANLRQSLTATNYVAPGKSGTFERVLTRSVNTFDYVVQHGKAINAYGMAFDSCQNEAVTGGQVSLGNYDAVIWASGNEATADETFSSAEQSLVTSYLNANGNLFVSGSEIGWDLDRASGPTSGDRTFFNNSLKAKLLNNNHDDSQSWSFSAAAGSIFAGNASGAFDDGNQEIYWVAYPDVLTPTNGSIAAINYVGGIGGAAALQYNGTVSGGKVIIFGFPFETITSATVRNAYMADILKFFSNTSPTLATISNKTVNEQSLLTFTASGSDTDIPAQTLTYSLDAGTPAGASINASSGVFTWTPTEVQGPNVYSITVRVTDNGSPNMSATRTFSVTVNEVNVAPVMAAIGNKSVNEGSALSFTASATDADSPANTLTYSLDAGAPTGASINATSGAFSWTPTEAQGPGNYPITVRVTDNGSPALNDFETITVTVNEINVAPVLAAISNYTILDGELLTFTASAADADVPSNTLTYSLDAGAPTGASIHSASGVFTWTPTPQQAPTTNSITVRVTDNGSPALSNTKTFTVVVNSANTPPSLSAIANQNVNEGATVSLAAQAVDAGVTANVMTIADFENYSNGTVSGTVMFRPPVHSGTTSAFVDTTATNYTSVTTSFPSGPAGSKVLRASWSFKTGMSNPWIRLTTASTANLPNPTIAQGQVLKFDIYTDKDLKVALGVRETDTSAAPGADGGTSGSIEFVGATGLAGSGPVPTRTIAAGTWTTLEFNFPAEPAVGMTGNGILESATTGKGVLEHLALVPAGGMGAYNVYLDNITVAKAVTFSLDAGAPAGAAIDPVTGEFSWTTTEANGPGNHSVTVRATDNANPSASDTETFTITVNEVNVAPVLAAIGNKNVNEGSALTFTASATDADTPANTLTYSLDAGAPSGASINATSGAFSWTPTEAQGPGNHSITVRVTDNGSPALSDFETITVTVSEVNVAPVLAVIGNKSVNEVSALTFTASATDADTPANTLTYSLDAGAPAGASINATSGAFSWTPSESQGGANYSITVRVTDNGSPSYNDSETITVTVNDVNVAPILASIGNKNVNEGSALTFTASATDADLPANTLTYSLDAGAPSGASINATSGAFAWTPTEAQGGVNYSITVRVTDNGSPSLNDSETITVTVNEVNSAPTLTLPANATATEPIVNFESFSDNTANSTVMFRRPNYSTTTTTFLDATTNYSRVTSSFPSGNPRAGSKVLRAGWGFKTGSSNRWLRLTTDQAPSVPNPTVDFGHALRFDIYTTKTLKVGTGLRETSTTAEIGGNGGNSGTIEWVGATNVVGSTPQPNRAVSANIWTTLQFDFPTEPVRAFSGNGVLSSSTGKGTLEELSLLPNGTWSGTNTIYLDNFEVVYTRALTTVTMNAGSTLAFSAAATDPDSPAQTLTYNLDAGAPTGATINSSSGAFSWTPTSGQASSTNVISVRATDNGSPAQSNAKTFTVIVKTDPITVQASVPPANQVGVGETVTLEWNAEIGKTYRVQYKENVDEQWTDLIQVVATQALESVVVVNTGAERLYRVVLVGNSIDE